MNELYTIRPAVNTKETGSAYPQAGLTLNYNRKSPNSIRNLKSCELPSFEPNFNYFELKMNANTTDLLSASMSLYGLMISKKLKFLLLLFDLQEFKLFDVPVLTPFESYQYYWLHFGPTDILKKVNYPESEFSLYEFGAKKENISINSFEDFTLILKSISNMSYIKAEKITLFTLPTYDLFVIPLIDGQYIISNKLKNEIERSKLTGIEIKPASHIKILNNH
ncbi:MAG: hypothetical protein R2771_02385 [Saprospiraceae bacterium]